MICPRPKLMPVRLDPGAPIRVPWTVVDTRLLSDRFPRSNEYHPAWVISSCSGGANALWLTEWFTSVVDLRPGMRVLDLGCGRAMSSIFLRREFGIEVWATDLWFSASENLQNTTRSRSFDGVSTVVGQVARPDTSIQLHGDALVGSGSADRTRSPAN